MPVPPADLFNNASTSTAPTTALELDLEKPLTVTRDSFLQGQIKVDKGLLEQEDVYIEVTLCRNHEKWNYRRDGPSYPYWTVDLKSKAIIKTLWRARDGALVHSHRPQLKYTADEGPRPLVSPLALAPSRPDEEDPDCSKAHFALLLDGGALECEELEHTWTKPVEREILVLSVCLRKASAGLSMLGCDQVWSNLFKAGQRGRSQGLRRVKTKYINRAQARSVVFVPAKACCDQLPTPYSHYRRDILL